MLSAVFGGDQEVQTRTGAKSTWKFAALSLAVLLAAFWAAARHFGMPQRLSGHFASACVSFALLMAIYWAFGFGAADVLKHNLRTPAGSVLAPGLLVVPYLVFALPRGDVHAGYCAFFLLLPIGIAALFECTRPAPGAFSWQDAVALAAIGVPVELRWVANAWPGVSAVPKLLLVDAALYAYLVVRRLGNVGYDLRPRLRDFAIGLREWTFFAPIGVGLGLALGFIHFYARVPGAGTAAAAWLITFFFVAIPEELFFRGLLLNLLEPRMGKTWALAVSSVIFGLSHFNKGAPVFNWRYVLLASIAGVFYGRTWFDRRRLFSSATTHTTVDVVWSLWFR